MRRDRQMFPPRQLLHAAARLHLIYQRNKERKKEGKKRRKEGRRREKKGGKIHLSVTPLSNSSPWEEREKEIPKKKRTSQHPRKRVDRPHLEERNPCVASLNLSIDRGDKRVGGKT